MTREGKPVLGRVALFMAVSAAAMFLLAGYIWARQPMESGSNELAVMVLAIMGIFELGLAMVFFRRSGW